MKKLAYIAAPCACLLLGVLVKANAATLRVKNSTQGEISYRIGTFDTNKSPLFGSPAYQVLKGESDTYNKTLLKGYYTVKVGRCAAQFAMSGIACSEGSISTEMLCVNYTPLDTGNQTITVTGGPSTGYQCSIS